MSTRRPIIRFPDETNSLAQNEEAFVEDNEGFVRLVEKIQGIAEKPRKIALKIANVERDPYCNLFDVAQQGRYLLALSDFPYDIEMADFYAHEIQEVLLQQRDLVFAKEPSNSEGFDYFFVYGGKEEDVEETFESILVVDRRQGNLPPVICKYMVFQKQEGITKRVFVMHVNTGTGTYADRMLTFSSIERYQGEPQYFNIKLGVPYEGIDLNTTGAWQFFTLYQS